MMRLSKYDLISPSAYLMDGVGHIKAVQLKDIDALPYKLDTYRWYLAALMFSINDYIEQLGVEQETIDSAKETYEASGLEFTVFDLHLVNAGMISTLLLALDFFISEDVSWDSKISAFVVHNGTSINENGEEVADDIVGHITRDNYQDVVDVILQRCAVKTADDIEEEHPRFKNEKARKMWERYQAFVKKQKEAETQKNSEFFELGNIISALAHKQPSLNMLNIWDMTIYNVYDQFDFERDGVGYDISALNYSVWGADEKHHFDIDAWFKRKSPVTGSSDDLFSMAQNAKNN